MVDGVSRRKLAIHGPLVELDCSVPFIEDSIDALLGKFAVDGLPDTFPTTGVIHPYDESEVFSRLPSSARHVTRTSESMDVYEEMTATGSSTTAGA